ncbi:hypothetical protein conserved [Leishmania donovani]|uniref:Uncharacterized protein n=4 Tax=Leishmania donovani species complex TaxID=38574 RepID=A4HS18_LEIIN|nr:conserved hypothetical protein [Leishmania infantum JPCM5]XP_003858085.1 hypothetical protein, conserved [Leishmania donovani]CAC9440723.1 hypothetical_protein_-_conserved [Leishmania infantum]AYU75801.1 hypothetical protein LdCL_040007700 [Leishmania donovani]TPP51444.1 hypothetical protein CGC21_2560 [Leishmania donovani]CAJ1985868.1 hypothetical protein conserved [Leishmania donovani]CAM65046.1 conserved hypothetical protein [Leishmania infantum JPCM5]|eukprot:XP_001462860.1 conserved hypothetical protein [Leishmania infantum JPCM5]
MATMENVAFAGYAYYSTGGEGFIYALSSKEDVESTGTPVIIVNATSKAVNFFPFLFLVVGGVLMVGLMASVMVTFCCRRKVAKLEKMYWELQYAFADVNNTLVQEASRRTTSPASLKQKHTPQSTSCLVAGSQSPPQMMQRHGSIARVASMRPSQHIMEPLPPAAPVFPAAPLPYGMNANPLYFQPVTTSAASPYTCSHGGKGAQVTVFAAQPPPIPSSPQPQRQTRLSVGPAAPQSPCTTPEPPLRRRASKVSFIGA